VLVFLRCAPTKSECDQEQPSIMPRPDLEKLRLNYRRIPILTVGRDVYLDTRLILRKLEAQFPDGKLGSNKPEDKFVEKLLEKCMIEGPVFATAAGLVPTKFVGDPTFVYDRKGFCGREWTAEALDEGRPECLAYVRNMFDIFETTVLSDGRDWVLNTPKPSLADIEGACHPFERHIFSLYCRSYGPGDGPSILSAYRRALHAERVRPSRKTSRHGAQGSSVVFVTELIPTSNLASRLACQSRGIHAFSCRVPAALPEGVRLDLAISGSSRRGRIVGAQDGAIERK